MVAYLLPSWHQQCAVDRCAVDRCAVDRCAVGRYAPGRTAANKYPGTRLSVVCR